MTNVDKEALAQRLADNQSVKKIYSAKQVRSAAAFCMYPFANILKLVNGLKQCFSRKDCYEYKACKRNCIHLIKGPNWAGFREEDEKEKRGLRVGSDPANALRRQTAVSFSRPKTPQLHTFVE